MSDNIKKSKVKLTFDITLVLISQIIGILFMMWFFTFIIFSSFMFSYFKHIGKLPLFFVLALVVVILGFVGFKLWRWAKRTKKLTELFKDYVYIMSVRSNSKLKYIANIAGESQGSVTNNISKMIDKGYFCNARIDKSNNELLIAGKSLYREDLSNSVETICKSCSATSRNMIGEDTYCEYCGSLL